jgi:hypothetical protein
MSELDVVLVSGVLVVLANFIVSRRIKSNDDSTKGGKLLIEVASLGLLIVSFIIYIIIIS